ncbi:MAG: glycosyltransferase, partial [Rikenellaceae bacterium]
MDISVIIPIWNVENYIERCLRSIFEQTKTEGVEFILVNDCTPDGSMEVARRVIAEYPNLTVRI